MAQSQLSFAATADEQELHLSVAGELDRAEVHRFERALYESLPAHAQRLVLDLSRVTFLDLAGVRSLIRAHARMQASGVDMSIVRPAGAASRIFTLTPMGEILNATRAKA
jgi:anti-sigma B factor antagonist